MKRWSSRVTVTGLVFLVFAGLLVGCATREEVQERQRKLSSVQAQLDQARDRIEQKNTRIAELKQQVESLKQEVETLSKERAAQVEDLKAQIEKLQKEKAQLQEEQDRLRRLRKQNKELQEKLSEIKEAKTTIERDNLVVTLESNILFDLGEAKLKSGARETLDKVARAFAEYENRPIAVEGHTDTLPIQTERFPSNWHLSAARAVSVIQYLVENHNISPDRFIAAGFGEHHPVVPNTSAENRQQNRRVEIVLYPPGISGQYRAGSEKESEK